MTGQTTDRPNDWSTEGTHTSHSHTTAHGTGDDARGRTSRRRVGAVRPWMVVPAIVALAAGCSHVKLEPAGESVRRLGAQEAPACERLGTTRAQVLSKVLFFDRSETKMSEDLTVLARNAAAGMGGNAVIAEGPITKGKQAFGVYRCPEE